MFQCAEGLKIDVEKEKIASHSSKLVGTASKRTSEWMLTHVSKYKVYPWIAMDPHWH